MRVRDVYLSIVSGHTLETKRELSGRDITVNRRRSSIEPAIGHIRVDGKRDRNWLQGALGYAVHAELCGAGHNLHVILTNEKRAEPICSKIAGIVSSAVQVGAHRFKFHERRHLCQGLQGCVPRICQLAEPVIEDCLRGVRR